MISPVPAVFAIPVIVVVALITAARWIMVRDSVVDHLINRSLTWALAGLLLHERGVAPGIASWLHQFSLGCILFTLSGVYGIAALWGGADEASARPRQRRYDAAAAAVLAVVLLAGTPARSEGLLIDQALGVPSILLWGIFGVPLAVCAVRILRLGAREFRATESQARERLVYAVILAAAGGLLIDAIAGPSVAAVHVLTGTDSPDPQMVRKAATFFAATLCAAVVTSIPLVTETLSRWGWAGRGREIRVLRPMWRDLTDVFPDVVLYTPAEWAALDDRVRLHRMTVEIHDALMRLRRGAEPPAEPIAAAPERAALRIARALGAEREGLVPSRSADFETYSLPGDSTQLSAIAASWPDAVRRVGDRTYEERIH